MPLVSLAMRPLLELWAEMRTVLELQAVENEKLLRLRGYIVCCCGGYWTIALEL